MTRREFIESFSKEYTDGNESKSARIVDSVLSHLLKCLEENDEINLKYFGKFTKTKRTHYGMNFEKKPYSTEKIHISFKPSRNFIEELTKKEKTKEK